MLLRTLILLICVQLTSRVFSDDGWSYFQAVHSNWTALEQFDLLIEEEKFEPQPDVTIETRSNMRIICSYSTRQFVGLVSSERVATATETGEVLTAKHLSATVIKDGFIHEIFPLANRRHRQELRKDRFTEVSFPEIRLIGLDIKQPRMESLESVEQASNIITLIAKSSDSSVDSRGKVTLSRQLPWSELEDGTASYSYIFSFGFDPKSLMPSTIRAEELWDRSGEISRTPSRSFAIDWVQHRSGLFVPESISSTFSRWAIDKQHPKHVKPFNEQSSAKFRWRSINQDIPEHMWDANRWSNVKLILEETKLEQ